jgi:hypothetical protein
MAFRNDGSRSDNGFLQSIPDCTPEQEEAAVEAVRRNCQDAKDGGVLLSVLGLTGTAEGMLAARDRQHHRPSSAPA